MQGEKQLIVVALGGNAILQPGQRGTFEEQMHNVHVTCEQLAQMMVDSDLVLAKNELKLAGVS